MTGSGIGSTRHGVGKRSRMRWVMEIHTLLRQKRFPKLLHVSR